MDTFDDPFSADVIELFPEEDAPDVFSAVPAPRPGKPAGKPCSCNSKKMIGKLPTPAKVGIGAAGAFLLYRIFR